MSRVFGRPRIQRAWGIGAGPRGPAQPDLILVLLGGAEAAGLQQRGEAAARTQRRAGLPLQEAGFRRREALAAQRGFEDGQGGSGQRAPPPKPPRRPLTSRGSPLSRSSRAGSGRPGPPACRPPCPLGPWRPAPACRLPRSSRGSWARAATTAPCCCTPDTAQGARRAAGVGVPTTGPTFPPSHPGTTVPDNSQAPCVSSARP